MNEAFEKWWTINYGMWNLSTNALELAFKELAEKAWEAGHDVGHNEGLIDGIRTSEIL
jgi:hypothetical protein